MRKLTILTLSFVLTLSGAFCTENTESTLALKDAILIAFSNNKDIQIQEFEIGVARANILGAVSNFLPDINLNYSYTHNDKVLAENIYSGYYNDNNIGLSLTESLINGGANVATLKQAQLNLQVSEETLRAKKLDVEFETKRLYYGLLLAYETERIARDLISQAKAHYKDVENKYQQGTSSRFDLLQSRVQVSLLMPELVKAGNEIKLIKAELNKLLGRKIDEAVTTKEILEYSRIEIKEREFLKEAYLNKPEMMLKNLGIDINKWQINLARSGYRPQLDLQADYYYRSNNLKNIINGGHRNWSAGLKFTLPIFEGFSTKAKVDAAKARFFQSYLDKDNLVDQIAVDIRQACLNLAEAEAIILSQKDNIEEAREALRISEVSYDNGVGTNLDVLDAQTSLAQIQKNLADGIYDYLMAKAFLDRSRGESYIKEAKNEKKGN